MLSHRIRELRLAKNLSQVQLAALLGVTKQSVSNWENDNIQPSVDMLLKLSDVLGASTDYLLGLEHGRIIDVSDLTPDEIAHIQQLVADLRRR